MLIFNKDPLRASVEAATGGKVTVLYDDKGYPSYMEVVPKFNVEDIDADLGTGVHPAFIVNGVEKSEIFVGQYKANVLDGRALSLPGYDQATSITFDNARAACTAKGPGWHMMTNWEAAALAHWCVKNGQPRGNTYYGRHHVSTHEAGRRQDGIAPGTASGTARTLNGSGPASWRHDGTMAGIDGLVGNVWEWIDGMKLVAGKFYFPDDNYYAQAEASWKDQGVIVALDTTVKLGVAGTDTLHTSGSVLPWCSGLGRTTAYAALSDAVKRRFMQAMIDPAFNTSDPVGYFYWNCDGEHMPRRFGRWYLAGSAGVAALFLGDVRACADTDIGFRPAYIG